MSLRIAYLLAVSLCLATSSQALPTCDVLSGVRGAPAIVVDGQPLSPIFFAANNQWGRDGVLVETLRRAAEADVALFSFNLSLPWHASDAEAMATVDKFCAAHPSGYFYVRIWLGPNAEWLEANPQARITYANGQSIDMASPSSAAWREEARNQLTERIRLIAEGPHGNRFIGVAPAYLNTGEWFYPHTNDYGDYSPANTAAFRDWLRATYGDVDNLRDAWGQPEVTFETAEPPTPAQREATAWGPFRDPVEHRPAIDFTRFQSQLIADTIAYFARAVKEATDGKALAGAFYGYTMELNHNGPSALAHSGHLALGRLLTCEDLDIIHAPYSYFERGLGQPGHFHLPVDSVALHGKLVVIEDDSFTHLASQPEDQTIAPGWQHRTQTREETLDLVLRNFGNALAHRCGIWYFDLLSDGRWNDPGFWQQAGLLRRMAAEMRSEPPFEPQIAFVVDEEVVPHLGDATHPWLLESLAQWRSEMARIGAPVGYYLQSDLPHLPRSVKLAVLANAYQVDEAEQTALEQITARGGTVVYTYAAHALDDQGRVDLGRAGDELGFPIEARWDTQVPALEFSGQLKPIQINTNNWNPRLIIHDASDNVLPLANYMGTDELAVAMRTEESGRVVYGGMPRLPAEFVRELARETNLHLHRDPPGWVAVAGTYLFTHTADSDGGVNLHFRWPAPMAGLTRLTPPLRYPLVFGAQQWDDVLPPRVTAVYSILPGEDDEDIRVNE